jgi:hypothetical protein
MAVSACARCSCKSARVTRRTLCLRASREFDCARGLSARVSGNIVRASASSCFDNSPLFASTNKSSMPWSENRPKALRASSRFPPSSSFKCPAEYSAAHLFPVAAMLFNRFRLLFDEPKTPQQSDLSKATSPRSSGILRNVRTADWQSEGAVCPKTCRCRVPKKHAGTRNTVVRLTGALYAQDITNARLLS